MYLEIILNLPVNQGFTYSYIAPPDEKPELVPQIGKRAEIMFGNKKTQGFIINISETIPASCPVDASKIRPIKRILDKEPLFGEELTEIARWISRYYLCTLGEAVFAMIPSGRRDSSAGGFSFEEEFSPTSSVQLSQEQQTAVDNIIQNKTGFHYVYGPTGTGKTEVFLSLAEKILKEGKGVIYLVPEISLTGQVAKAVAQRFGNTSAILHSGLTPSQRLGEWHRIMHKEARVIVGARSAIFAPVPDLGLVIIDEEHDGSYKSGNNPRYHARQVAMHRCSKLQIPLVMGSATPSVEAWYGMKTGTITSHTLTKRLAGGEMPKVSCINLNNYTNDGCISKPLQEQINKTLEKGHQTILFLNRRGFTHYFSCNLCGYELVCKNCSVPLTYHRNENRLRCHYCGWSITPPESCPQCGSMDIGSNGFGTEYIEAETKAKFPNARIIRLDTDVLKDKEQLLQTLEDFRQGKYDIMLGTQMVAKGLDFEDVTLVGVLAADLSLYVDDYRAGERTFSLLTQVVGRAGRGSKSGRAVIQTWTPENEVITLAARQDYDAFYEQEIPLRRLRRCPPFAHLFVLSASGTDEHAVLHACQRLRQGVEQALRRPEYSSFCTELFGPAPAAVAKVNNRYRYRLTLSAPNTKEIRALVAHLVRAAQNDKENRGVSIFADMDPLD